MVRSSDAKVIDEHTMSFETWSRRGGFRWPGPARTQRFQFPMTPSRALLTIKFAALAPDSAPCDWR